MTVIADNKKRVVLAQAKPGDRFDVQVSATGYLLRKLEPVQSKPAKVRFTKRDGYTVAMTDQPINEEALRESLADFPAHSSAIAPAPLRRQARIRMGCDITI